MYQGNKFKLIAFVGGLLAFVMLANPALAQRGEDNNNQRRQNQNQNYQSNGCSEYRLSAFGGEAGIRVMSNPKDFRRASNGSIPGQLCQNGQVTIELAKRHPNTHVTLVINGREYVFGQGDRGNKVVNNWFRRYFQINLSQHSSYQNNNYGNGNHSYSQHSGHQNRNNRYSHGSGQQHQNSNWQNNNWGWNNGYDVPSYGGYPEHQHSYNQQKPRLRAGSKLHRKAHRNRIPHEHYGNNLAYQ